ncbi:MATE family efflux transporter [Paenibacillus sp. FA6]|uniref:MATE family efflux transporter n=1 Tax=Paenibacillus sp. FA6 TaxID=3413029 RepID=UPI003F65C3D1
MASLRTNDTYSLYNLAWPIMLEMSLQFMIGTVDTIMVSKISDEAVAAVGICNQFFAALFVLFAMISGGSGILVAQKLGSGNELEARKAASLAFSFNVMIGIAVSIVIHFNTDLILALLQVPLEIRPLAQQYLYIVGSGALMMALLQTCSTIIRNTGNTKATMMIAVGMNLIHILLNYLFIFGSFGFPEMGMVGVGISTVLSRSIAVIMLFMILLNSFSSRLTFGEFVKWNKKIVKEIAKIGIPLSLSGGSYSITQLVIASLIGTMGAMELATRSYLSTVESFAFLFGMAIAMAVQIRTAHLYGSGKREEAYSDAWKAVKWGVLLVEVNTLILVICGKYILGWFTSDESIIATGVFLLIVNIVLQPGKMINMTMGNALNAVGQTRYVMTTSIISMWIVSVGLAYLLGIVLEMGLFGVYIAMIADEYLRGVLVALRWKKRKGHMKDVSVQASEGIAF